MLDRYRPEDREALLALHERTGAEMLFPAPEGPLHFATLVDRREDGSLGAVMAGRYGVEAFLMLDKDGAPAKRWATLKGLLDMGRELLLDAGLHEVHMHTHDFRFARRMARLPGVVAATPHHLVYHFGGD